MSPRPPVGAVVVSPDGEVVGEGFTRRKPGPHAEGEALEQAGERARDATVYVTLEPCNIVTSKPASCAELLIAAGVRRVVAAIVDPCPDVDGRGFAMLREAGIDVVTGPGAIDATALIEPFAKWTKTTIPFVTLKLAASLDGKVAAPDGTSRWITGPEARAEVHELRRRVDAVLVGSMHGRPRRPAPHLSQRRPRRRSPCGSSSTAADDRPPTRACSTATPDARDHQRRARRAVRRRLARHWGGCGRVPAGESADRRARGPRAARLQGLCHVLVEGGPTIASSFVEHGLVDRFVLYLAPKLIGGEAPGLLNDGAKTLSEAWDLHIEGVTRVGEDIRIDARSRESS